MSRLIYIFFIGVLSLLKLNGQSPIITCNLDKDSMFIGESVNFTFNIKEQIKIPGAKLILNFKEVENLAYSQDTNSLEKLADIEVINGFDLDNYMSNNSFEIPIEDLNKKQFPFKSTVSLGIYSIGAFHFTPPIVIGENGDTLFKNNGTFLFVKPPIGFGQDSTKVINPIRPIIEIANSWKDYLWVLWIIIGLLLTALVLYYVSKRKPKELIENSIIVPEIKELAHVVALRKLNHLQLNQIWKEGKIKEYQSELTNIIREYLEGRYKINALEMTSTEVLEAIDKQPSMKGQVQSLKNVLTVADLVKFAKAQPADDIHQEFLNTAIQFVHKTKDSDDVE